MKRFRVRLNLQLTFFFTLLLVAAIGINTLISIQRAQENFRIELEQQAALTLDVLSAATIDALIFYDVDELSDIMENLGEDQGILSQGRIYDADGRVIVDAFSESLTFKTESDEFGLLLLANNEENFFDWRVDQLIAGRSIRIGKKNFGAISIGIPTTQLDEKITSARILGGYSVGITTIIGIIVATIISRTITTPVYKLVDAARNIGQGDLTQPISPSGQLEMQELGRAMEQMRAELNRLYVSLEQQVRERTEELETSRDELAIARDIALDASSLKSSMLANVNHELRTPLNGILGYTEMLADGVFGDLTDQQNAQLKKIEINTSQMRFLVDNFLNLALIEAGTFSLNLSNFESANLLDNAEAIAGIQAKNKGLKFHTSIEEDFPAYLVGDFDRIGQIIINVSSNAIKFTDQGQIDIHISRYSTDKWQVKISDTGIGIPKEAREFIFEPFRQADTSITRRYQGAGLGLSIVKEFVNLMDGEIKIESEEGKGTTFTFIFPIEEGIKW